MSKLPFLSAVLFYGFAYSQELIIPSRPDHVAESDFRNGELMLKNAYQQVKEDNNNVLAHDYWNFAIAYYKMGQPKEAVYDFLLKASFTSRKDFCEIVNVYHDHVKGINNAVLYKLLGKEYEALVEDCLASTASEVFDIETYITANNYDKELIHQLADLLRDDQKFRKGKENDLQQRAEVDRMNIKKVETIIAKYGYPGKTLAGEKFDFVVWMVIQHAELEYQEKYLPVIAKAVKEKELDKTPLRMLIDRVYTKKTGLQIFGSQIGVRFLIIIRLKKLDRNMICNPPDTHV
ncbi:MAG: DUF6624 domain-containing protein [Bacteroidota bacterium]